VNQIIRMEGYAEAYFQCMGDAAERSRFGCLRRRRWRRQRVLAFLPKLPPDRDRNGGVRSGQLLGAVRKLLFPRNEVDVEELMAQQHVKAKSSATRTKA